MSQMNTGATPTPSGRPGQMTAVMRAMAQASGPKVLRIGLVTAGRIIEERIVKQRTTVTVGSSEKAMFVTQGPVPPQFKLFELVGNDYYLNFLDGMTGRVALASGITDIAALKGQARRVGNAYQVKLTEEARGKIVIGDTTFLFQFVAPPPIQPRPQLPLSVKGGNQVDWNFTMICAVSLLCHVAVILVLMPGGHIFYHDRDYVGEYRAREVRDTENNVPDAPTESKPDDKSADTTATDDSNKPEPKKTEKPKPAPGPPQPVNPNAAEEAKRAAEEARIRDLQQKAAAMGLEIIGAVNSSQSNRVVGGSSGQVVATSSDDLRRTAEGTSGTRTGGGFNTGGTTGVIDPNSRHGGTGLGGVGTGNQTVNPEPVVTAERKVITGSVSGSGSTVAGPAVANAQSVVAGLSGRVRFCYNQGLTRNENMSGTIRASITVGPSGDVRGVSLSPSGSLDGGVVSCVQGIIQGARFGKDEARTTSTVNASFNFVKQ